MPRGRPRKTSAKLPKTPRKKVEVENIHVVNCPELDIKIPASGEPTVAFLSTLFKHTKQNMKAVHYAILVDHIYALNNYMENNIIMFDNATSDAQIKEALIAKVQNYARSELGVKVQDTGNRGSKSVNGHLPVQHREFNIEVGSHNLYHGHKIVLQYTIFE